MKRKKNNPLKVLLNIRFLLSFPVLLLIILPTLHGQQEDEESGQSPLELEEPDSINFRIQAFHPTHPDDTFPVRDTILIYPNTHHDPLRRAEHPYRWLGNIGDPSLNLFWQPDKRIQFKTGVHPFRAHGLDPDSILFYNLNASYTHAYFSVGPNQNNTMLDVRFAREFTPRIQLSFDYRRINQVGIYNNQRNLHTSMNLGFRYRSEDSRWSTVLQFNSNVFQSQETGGIVSDTIFEQDLSENRMTIPTRTPEAETRQQIFHFRWYNRFHPNPEGANTMTHRTIYEPQYYKSYDSAPDSTYYGPLYTDDRGIRMYLRDRMLANEFSWILEPSVGELSLSWEFGLRHEFHWIATDIREAQRSDLGASAEMRIDAPRWSFDALAEGWTWDAKGAYKLDLGFTYSPFKGLKFRVDGLTQSSLIPYIFRTMDDPTGNQWSNSWNSVRQTKLEAGLNIRPLGLQLSYGGNRVQEPVYFDTEGIPQRLNIPLTWQYAKLRHTFQFWILKTRSLIYWQDQSDQNDILLLPTWYGEHRLSVKAPIFQEKLTMETGVDFRWMEDDVLPAYLPLTGQFHLPKHKAFKGSWTGSFFLAFRIKRFTGFIRLENLKDLALDERTYWVAHYPQLDFGWRLGLRWGFIN